MELYPCLACDAAFARPYAHCTVCGWHYLEGGPHDCPGPIDHKARQARALAWPRGKLTWLANGYPIEAAAHERREGER